MCLILFSYNQHPEFPLVLAANRDEFYNRPAEKAKFWKSNPEIVAGVDLTAGGTWMGITKHGKMAMITNYRDLRNIKQEAPSRGHLVADFLIGKTSAATYMENLISNTHEYNGYNLIVGD